MNINDILDMVWNAALDASTSKDFRLDDGNLNEEAYGRYQKNIFRKATDLIEKAINP